MRKLIIWNVMTVDGYFEGTSPWALDFHLTVWGEELEALSLEQLAGMDTLLFGRKTYEGMAAHWSSAEGRIAECMNRMQKVVASRTLSEVGWNNSRLLRGDLATEVKRLKKQSGKAIYIFGSAELTAQLLDAGLVDEYRLCIAPVLLGGGNPLFKQFRRQLDLELYESRPLKSGGVLMFYKVRGESR